MDENKQINWLNDVEYIFENKGKNNKGETDNSNTEEDNDGLYDKSNISALVKVITECKAPFNICIQGEWGSGKTSLMKELCKKIDSEKKIDPKKKTSIYYDIMDDIRLDSSERIFYNFVVYMFKILQIENEKIINFLTQIEESLDIVDDKKYGLLKMIAFWILGRAKSRYKIKGTDGQLKNTFEEIISEYLENEEEKYIVLFIDNLDRLDPVLALEFVENLKVFLDCEYLKIVMAIDFDIVAKGVKIKYRDDISHTKSIQFFEKYFQLSFKMPQNKYEIVQLIENFNKDNGGLIEIPQDFTDSFGNFLKSISFNNPRSIKKIFNQLLFLNEVDKTENIKNFYRLIALIIESKSIELYSEIINGKVKLTETDEIDSKYQEDYDSLLELFSNTKPKIIEEFLDEFTKTKSASKEIKISSKQNHTINIEVQEVIRKMFNDICDKDHFDLENKEQFGKESKAERTGDIKHIELVDDYSEITVTNGKGQGLYFTRKDGQFKVYLSGDYNGKMMNDGMQTLNGNLKDNIWDGEKYYATELLMDENKYQEFLGKVISKLKTATKPEKKD